MQNSKILHTVCKESIFSRDEAGNSEDFLPEK